ncbi:MAG TPA: hypothetical protein VFU49_15550 [Ktedonobacteraceae bacterium]|nr:hypothetical protein [Ktedonobacteraceae bacterium]
MQPITNSAGLPIFNEPVVPPCTVRGSSEPGTIWALGSIEDNSNCLNEINKTHLDSAYDDTKRYFDIDGQVRAKAVDTTNPTRIRQFFKGGRWSGPG